MYHNEPENDTQSRLRITGETQIRERRREFRSDGCTLSPEGAWHDCCVEHDRAYFCGGSDEDRLKADQALRDCIRAKGYPITAAIYYRAVRIFGNHFWPRTMKPSALVWAGPVKRGGP